MVRKLDDGYIGQRLVDSKVNISVVSVVMGHKSTRTTEQYYARIKQIAALEEIDKAFKNLKETPEEYTDSQMPKGFDSVRVASQEGPKAVRDSKNLYETH